VVLRSKNETAVPIITKPLRPRRAAETPWGKVKHVDLIGKKTRDVVETDKGVELRAMLPTLEEYVLLTPRIVTPVSSFHLRVL
jgi:tRNA A58 N-methylase Trm61